MVVDYCQLLFDKVSYTASIKSSDSTLLTQIKEDLECLAGIPVSLGHNGWRYQALIPQEGNNDYAIFQFGGDWENIKGRYRLEFNPQKVSFKLVWLFAYLISKTRINLPTKNQKSPVVHDIKLTRIDYAIDLPHDINELDINYKKNVKKCIFKDQSDNLETVYLGARSSEKVVRIYNKAKEQGLKDVKWTRVEVQIRQDVLLHNFSYYNPFENLEIRVKNYDEIHQIDLGQIHKDFKENQVNFEEIEDLEVAALIYFLANFRIGRGR